MLKRLLPLCVALLLAGCGEQAPEIDLWAAAGSGNTAAIEQHVEYGTDLNAKEPGNGGTPLIVAAVYGQTEAARLLVERGASLAVKNNDGSTPLHVATFFCRPEIVALLLEAGADRGEKDNNGQTPLDLVSGAWSQELEQIYAFFAGLLQLELDMERIKAARPEVAAMLQQGDE